MAATESPRVYIASLADYNCGTLHGVHVTLDETLDLEGLNAKVKAMLARSPSVANGDTAGCPAEEWAIHDYEGFGEIRLGEWASWERVLDLAGKIREHGPEVVSGYLDCCGDDADLDGLQEAYQGQWASEEAFAEDLVESCGGLEWFGPVVANRPSYVPEDVQAGLRSLWEQVETYIDWEKVASSLFSGGDHTSVKAGAPDYGIHVFKSI